MKKMPIERSNELYADFLDVPTLVDEIIHCRPEQPNDKLAAMMHNYICNASAESNGTVMDNEDVITTIDDALSGIDMMLEDANIQINHNVADEDGMPWLYVEIISYGESVLSFRYNVPMARAMFRKRRLQLERLRQKQQAAEAAK